ncbi:MAG: M20 family metallopeptidase [Chloroflexota bacterium]|nr:M20 family metallopeptidase [Chloroflexota bacterium]
MTSTKSQRQIALDGIEAARQTILEAGDTIHANPEIGMKEYKAVELLTDIIASFGFEVERGVAGIETAFKARKRGNGEGPRIAYIAEYDALPGLGHGCGHNLLASSNLAAAIGLGAVVDELGGDVLFIGTPAEESHGAKAPMIEAGVFRDVDIAMSSHHGGHITSLPIRYPDGTCLAVSSRQFKFHGRTAHAAKDPETGVNALNAVIQLFNGIDAMRQHVTPDVRMHGIITDGGKAPNVVPDYAEAEFLFRAASRAAVDDLISRAEKVALGAGMITGAKLEIETPAPDYDDMLPNYTLSGLIRQQLAAAGLEETNRQPSSGPGAYSTDLGNVSRAVPTTSLTFAISETPINGHTQDVVDASISELGRENALRTGKALALAGVELLANPELAKAIRREFEEFRPT